MSGKPNLADDGASAPALHEPRRTLFAALVEELKIGTEAKIQALREAIIELRDELPNLHPALNALADAAGVALPPRAAELRPSKSDEALLRGISGWHDQYSPGIEPLTYPARALIVVGCLARLDPSFRQFGKDALVSIAKMVNATSGGQRKFLLNALHVWNHRPDKSLKSFVQALLAEIREKAPDQLPAIEALGGNWLPTTAVGPAPPPKKRPKRRKKKAGTRKKRGRPKSGDSRYRRRRRLVAPEVGETNNQSDEYDPTKYDRRQGDDGAFEDGVRVDGSATKLPKRSAVEITDSDIEDARETADRDFSVHLSTQHLSSLCLDEAKESVRLRIARFNLEIEERKQVEAHLDYAALLTAAAGIDFETTKAIQIIAEAAELKPNIIDLKRGLLVRAALTPKRSVPPRDDPTWYDESTLLVLLPLPPTLIDVCRKLLAFNEGGDVRAVLQGIEEKSFRKHLKSFQELASISQSAARTSHILRASLYEHCKDMTVTMQACGNTFWKSTTSLHYVAPRAEHLATLYRAATWPIFGDKIDLNSLPPECDGRRVGLPAIVTAKRAASLVRSLSRRWMKNDLSSLASAGDRRARIKAFHNSYMTQVAEHARHVSQHRPTNALFRLRRYDFDLLSHLVLPSDKRIDPAHWFRISSTTHPSSSCIGNYIEHLKILAELVELPAASKQFVLDVIDSKEALFFHFNSDLTIGKTTMKIHKALLGPVWGELQDNWNRSYFANGLREDGASPLATDIQLGQLELTGNPTSPTSGIAPIEWCEAVRPSIENLEALLGWRSKKGLSSVEHDPIKDLPPLIDYSHMVSEHHSTMDKVAARHKRVTSAKAASNKKKGWIVLSEALSEIRPDLLAYLQSSGFAKELSREKSAAVGTEQTKILNEDEVRRIEARLDHLAKKQAVFGAALNAFFRCARHAAKKGGWDIPTPSLWFDRKTAEPTPFFSGMMLPRMMVLALRTKACELPPLQPASLDPDAFLKALAKSALQVALFTNVSTADEVAAILLADDAALSNVPNAPDAIVVHIVRNKRRIGFILRGIARIAFDALRQQHEKDLATLRATSSGSAEAFIRTLSLTMCGLFNSEDQRLLGQTDRFLGNLCSAIRINNLVEQSPACRAAYSDQGSWTASPESSRAFLFNEARDATSVASSHKSKQVTRQSGSDSHSLIDEEALFYAIQGVLDQKGDEIRRYHARAAQDLLDLFPQRRSSASYWIARFAIELLEEVGRGRGRLKKLSPATIQKFVGSFGLDLIVTLFREHGSADLVLRTAPELVSVYKNMLLNRSKSGSTHLSARQVLDFHRMLARSIDVAPISEDHFKAFLIKPEQVPDAEVILDSEVHSTIDELSKTLDAADTGSEELSANDYWVVAAARVILILLWATGARISECAALCVGDIVRIQNHVIGVVVRPTRFRWLKSVFGRRLALFDGPLSEAYQTILAEWLRRLVAIHGCEYSEKTLLFNAADIPSIRLLSDNIRSAVYDASLNCLGFTLKLHRLRHSLACKRILRESPKFLFGNIFAVPLVLAGPKLGLRMGNDLLRLQHLREVAVSIGHSGLGMTISQYFHFPWALVNCSAALSPKVLGCPCLAGAANQDGHAAVEAYGIHPLKNAQVSIINNKGKKTFAHKNYERLSSLALRHKKRKSKSAAAPHSLPISAKVRRRARAWRITPGELHKFIWRCINSEDPVKALDASILPVTLRSRIVAAIEALRNTTSGYDLFGDESKARGLDTNVQFARFCEGLITSSELRADIELICGAFAKARKTHRVQGLLLETQAAAKLKELLTKKIKLMPEAQILAFPQDGRTLFVIRRSSVEPLPIGAESGRAKGATLTVLLCLTLATCWIWLALNPDLQSITEDPRASGALPKCYA